MTPVTTVCVQTELLVWLQEESAAGGAQQRRLTQATDGARPHDAAADSWHEAERSVGPAVARLRRTRC
jgi:hypothetical protein